MKKLISVIKYFISIILYIVSGLLIVSSIGYVSTDGALRFADLEPFTCLLGVILFAIITFRIRNIMVSVIEKYIIVLYGIGLLIGGCYIIYTTKQRVFYMPEAGGYRYDICILTWILISCYIILVSLISVWNKKDVTLKQLLFSW